MRNVSAKMRTSAETAIVDYRLSFADRRKQTSDLPFPFAANKRKFAVSAFRFQKTQENCRFPLGSVFGSQALVP